MARWLEARRSGQEPLKRHPRYIQEAPRRSSGGSEKVREDVSRRLPAVPRRPNAIRLCMHLESFKVSQFEPV